MIRGTGYKVLLNAGYSPYAGKPWHLPKGKRPGKWMKPVRRLIMCGQGYHVCRDLKDLLSWLQADVYVIEWKTRKTLTDNKKLVVQQARLLQRLDTWNDRTALLFAADCAARLVRFAPKRARPLLREALRATRRRARSNPIPASNYAMHGRIGDCNSIDGNTSTTFRWIQVINREDRFDDFLSYIREVFRYRQAQFDNFNKPEKAVKAHNREHEWQANRLGQYLSGKRR